MNSNILLARWYSNDPLADSKISLHNLFEAKWDVEIIQTTQWQLIGGLVNSLKGNGEKSLATEAPTFSKGRATAVAVGVD